MRPFLARRLHTLAILSLAALIIGQLGSLHWFAELFSHFLPFYALAFLLAALAQSGYRRIIWLACTLAAAAWLVQPLALWSKTSGALTRSLIWYNVHLDNPDAAEESARLIAEHADWLALAEINLADPGWQTLRTRYPHGCEHREDSPFALAVWARTALADCRVHFSAGFPYIRAQLSDGTALYALHPPPPITAELAQARTRYLQESAAHIAGDPQAIAAGDLNLTPFSPLFRQFSHASHTTPQTPYWLPTWKPFFLNIDHLLSRGHTVQVRALPWQHSDHRPLRGEF